MELFTKGLFSGILIALSHFAKSFAGLIARSSNGRTFASEAEYLGPNPSLAAKIAELFLYQKQSILCDLDSDGGGSECLAKHEAEPVPSLKFSVEKILRRGRNSKSAS